MHTGYCIKYGFTDYRNREYLQRNKFMIFLSYDEYTSYYDTVSGCFNYEDDKYEKRQQIYI